ncbi:hypothetical protein ACFLVX_04715, partial [Chloroflexota bacterium]
GQNARSGRSGPPVCHRSQVQHISWLILLFSTYHVLRQVSPVEQGGVSQHSALPKCWLVLTPSSDMAAIFMTSSLHVI